ncbi:nucleoside diphosphate-linked moiety X motif 19-like isoform X1 [Centruroides sculpturatus]|uniref:nucleoside diphosphate-linked moiety X motif 19-like isoform X1 n=2 Tax=Centruroides sculpturatus TaxID=218467 RepID=UPI000C6EC697|nr:nucleoside diphosphate-linked moiety X motif 19-like isoform X1 [Centruroides sculpturatus]
MLFTKYIRSAHENISMLFNKRINTFKMENVFVSTMTSYSWREASSVIFAAKPSLQETMGKDLNNMLMAHTRNFNPSKFDYRLLMLKRSGLSSFMANAYVFPGGMVELSDFSTKWWTVFNNAGISNEKLMQVSSSITGPRPPMFENSVTLSKANISKNDHFPVDLTMRIAAIRETFEETGILLLTSSGDENKEPSVYTAKDLDLKMWRDKVHNNASFFIDLCLENKVCPNIWCLQEWWNWLTPNVGHRRYDTIFYVCCLSKIPAAWADQSEVTEIKWCTPEEILEENRNGSVFLAPPQIYELSRLLNFKKIKELDQFSKKRECRGIERWLPVVASSTDGAISVLPGDDLYPENPPLEGDFANPEYSFTIDELRSKSRNLNRLEINGITCFIQNNSTPTCGHVPSSKYPYKQPVIQSFL